MMNSQTSWLGIYSNTIRPSSLHNPKSKQLAYPSLPQIHRRLSLKSENWVGNVRLHQLSSFCCRCSSGTESEIKRKKLAVFVSGGGSNFKSIHDGCVRGFIHGDVVVLVTNNPGCGGAEFARNQSIPVITFPKSKDETVGGLSPDELVSLLRHFEVDFILLAGYLKLIPSELVDAYRKSILNIHPALLPAFGGKGYYGMKVHKAVIASGARYSGPTIHFVDDHYDTGRILAQRVVPVLANDTAEDLAARVLKEEHQLYVNVTAAICDERILWREDGVPIIQSKENPNKFT